MPQFKSIVTGNLATLSDQYAEATGGEAVWERIADEAPEETEKRLQVEAQQAYLDEVRANKVEIETDEPVTETEGSEAPVPSAEPTVAPPMPVDSAPTQSEGSDA